MASKFFYQLFRTSGMKTRQTEEGVGRQNQGMDRPGVRRVPKGSGDLKKMEETGCEVTCAAPGASQLSRF